jgi:hypothetical protein
LPYPQLNAATSLEGNDLAQSGLDACQELLSQDDALCLWFEVLGSVSPDHSKKIIKISWHVVFISRTQYQWNTFINFFSTSFTS